MTEQKSGKKVTTPKSPATVYTKAPEADMLIGMKAICSFLRMSEATILKWMREYDDFPVKKNGVCISSRLKLNAWFQAYLESK